MMKFLMIRLTTEYVLVLFLAAIIIEDSQNMLKAAFEPIAKMNHGSVQSLLWHHFDNIESTI